MVSNVKEERAKKNSLCETDKVIQTKTKTTKKNNQVIAAKDGTESLIFLKYLL